MSDPLTLPPPGGLTPNQIQVLARFADHVSAGRRLAVLLFKISAGLGAFAGALAAFLYFVAETYRDWPWGVK